MLGVGTNNSIASFTSYTVQRLPVTFTYQVLEDLSDGVANKFTPQTGTWTTTSGTTGVYTATPPAGDAALTVRPLAVAPLSYVEYSATVKANAAGTSAGLIFAYTSANDFLYAGIIAGTNQVVLGHRSNGVWVVDASTTATITAGTNYTLAGRSVEGTTNTVNVVLNGKSVLSFNYNYLVHDGSIGLYARNGHASFDNVLIRGDDIAYAGGGAPQVAAVAAPASIDTATLTAGDLASIAAAAKGLWIDALGAGDPRLAILDQVTHSGQRPARRHARCDDRHHHRHRRQRRRVGVVRRSDAQRQQRVLDTPVERGVCGEAVERSIRTHGPAHHHGARDGQRHGLRRRTRARMWRA